MMEQRRIGDGVLELFAAVVLGLATVATAWCAYQAAQWNNRETDDARTAAEDRLEASRLFTLGSQKVAYDATLAALYAQAIVNNQGNLQQFYKDNLIRPDFLPVIQQWEQERASGEPFTKLLDNKDYMDRQFADSSEKDASAEAALVKSQEASDNAAQFIQTTIFFASALFFAGITSNFRARGVRLLLLLVAAVVFAAGAAGISDLPMA